MLNVALLEAISRICVENYVPLQYYFLSLWRENINERINDDAKYFALALGFR